MKNNNRGLRNQSKRALKPFPIIPKKRNVTYQWDTYGKLRKFKNDFGYDSFDSATSYLLNFWRKRQ